MNDTPPPTPPQPSPPPQSPPPRAHVPLPPLPSASAPPSPPPAPQQIIVQMAKRGLLNRLFGWLLVLVFLGSIGLNIFLGGLVAERYVGPFDRTVREEGQAEQEVAIIDVIGGIYAQQAERFEAFVNHAVENSNIKAVVIRVNSPGGAVGASREIHDAVEELKAAGKTVVVSMGDYAASGGYYISVPADYIFAEPTTLTGSIGVVSIQPNIKGALDKIGMKIEVIRAPRAPRKIEMNPFEEPSKDGRDAEVALLDKMHQLFIDAVDKGRTKLSATDVEALADGRVWMGAEAVANNLVDEEGDLDDAIAYAAREAGVSDPNVVHYKWREGLLDKLGGAEESRFRIDVELLDKLQTPRILMLWSPE